MEFITEENSEKKLYNIEYNIAYIAYNNYLQLFLDKNNLLHSFSSNKISFQANSLQSLDDYIKTQFLNEDNLKKFIYDLGSQILFLKENGIKIPYFSLGDIIIINHNNFLFINSKKLIKKRVEGDIISRIEGISSVDFIPPELLEKKDINISHIHYSSAYYSLAKLILYVFDFILENLYYTNVYFFLNRCLKDDPLKRDFLYI